MKYKEKKIRMEMGNLRRNRKWEDAKKQIEKVRHKLSGVIEELNGQFKKST